jgi:hypothetical protein
VLIVGLFAAQTGHSYPLVFAQTLRVKTQSHSSDPQVLHFKTEFAIFHFGFFDSGKKGADPTL